MSDGRIDSVINAKKCQEELESVYAAMGKIAELIIKVNELGKGLSLKGFKEGFDALKQAESGIRELNKAKEEAVRAESELRQALLESKKANQDLKNEIEALRLAEAKRREEARRRKEEMKGEKGSILDLREQLKKLLQTWDAYGAASRKANGKVLEDIKRVSAELKKLEAETGRHQRNVGNYTSTPQIVGGLKGLLGQFGIALGAGAIAKEIFDVTVKLDSMNAALRAVSGSESEFSKNSAFLVDVADRLGLNILDLTQSFKNFYAAGTQAGLTATQTRNIFNSVSEVAANLKLSQQDVNGIFTAFGQIASKGKVQAEELRGQIGERISGAFAIAARSIGVTTAQLDDMLKKGQVVAVDFLPKFAKELEKTYGIDNQKKVEGLQASINRLSNTFTDLVSDNQSALGRFFGMIINLANEALVSINNLVAGIVYVSLKLTDKTAAQDFLNAKAIDEYAAKLKKLQTDNVIGQRNAIDQRIEITENRLQGNLNTIKSIRDAYGKNADTVYGAFLQRTEKVVQEDQAALRLMEAQRQALVNELNRRFPGEEPPSTTKPDEKGPTKKELDAAARLKELQLKAEMEARKIELQEAIDSQKEIFENEKVAYEDRLVAAENYFTLKNLLAKEEADGEKKILDVEISRGRATAAQKVTVDKKAAAEQAQNRRELGKIVVDILKDNADKETKEILAAAERRKAELEKQSQDELATNQKLYESGKISKDQYELEKLRIENKYKILSLQAEYEYTEQIIKLMKLRGEDTTAQETELLNIKNKIRDLDREYFEKSEKEKTAAHKKELKTREDFEKEFAKKVKDLRQELGESVGKIIDGIFDRQKNRLQEEIDLISQRQEAEVAAVNASSDSEEEKAHKIAVINAQADAQKQALERRQKQFDQQKARFEKAKSVVEIVANTAIGVAKAFADYPYFLAAPLAAVIGAIGAAQLAAVLAQPIPKYKDGTEDHPGGLAHVGDGGVHEVIQSPDGRAWVTPASDTIMNIPAHYKVHPSVGDYLAAAGAGAMRPLPAIDSTSASVDRMTKAVLDGFGKQTDRIIDGLEKNKSTVHVNNTPLGVRATLTSAQKRATFLNHEFKI